MVNTTVEVAFELTVGDTPYFRLNDPVKGRLNNVSYRLAGPIFIDVTDQVAAVSISRGKNRELERYSAGNAQVTLHNENRWFDPLNAASPYVGNIIPRRAIRISSAGVTQFTGVIEDWNLDYDVSGKSNAVVQAADAFTLLAQQSLTAGTGVVESTGDRVNTVLSMPSVGWPLTQRRIDEGSAEVGADVFDSADTALSYLQLVEASEQGQLFMDREGYVRFVNGVVSATTAGPYGLPVTNLVSNPSMEAGSGTVTVRTNLVTNPSFETNTTGWGGFGSAAISRVTSETYSGGASLQIVATTFDGRATTQPNLSVTASTTYTASAWVKGEAGKTILIRLQETDSGGTTIGFTDSATVTATGSWQRVSVSRTFGSTGVQALVSVRNQSAGAHTFYVDAVQLEVGATASDYFDGSTSASGDFTYAWSGTAHASTSLQRGVGVNLTSTGSGAKAIQSSEWSSSGSKSVRIIPTRTTTNGESYVAVNQMLPATSTMAGKTYTVIGKVRFPNALQSVTHASALKFRAVTNLSPSGTQELTIIYSSTANKDVGGVYEVRGTFTVPANATTWSLFRIYNGSNIDDVWWDDLIIVEGNYTGDYFDGSTAPTFTDRYAWTGTPDASTSTRETREIIQYPLFSDDGNGIPYSSATVSYGTELLYNQVTVSAPTSTQTWENLDSQLKYGITTTDVETVLGNPSSVLSLAQFWVAKYGEPEYRFEALEISLDGLTGAQVTDVLNIELGDIVEIKFTPNNIGSPIKRYGQITKIDHSIGVDRHTVTFGFGSLQFSYLILDDTGFGLLDEYVLAF